MSFHFRRHDNFSRIVELTPELRREIEATVERLIAILDVFDGDENLEDDAGREPYLGWAEMEARYSSYRLSDDRELEDEHDEDGGDAEPDSDSEPDDVGI